MKIVLDTCVLISALITKDTPPNLLYKAWEKGLYELITSSEQLEEFSRVVKYPKLKKFLNSYEADQLNSSLHRFAHVMESIPLVSYSKDPDDNKIIATAIAGNANHIVSGDKKDVLSLNNIQNIEIVTAKKALEIIENNKPNYN